MEYEKKYGFKSIIKEWLNYISHLISANILSPIEEGTEILMRNLENRIIRVEKKILRDITSLLIIGFGGVFLIFALFFFLKEFLGLSNALAFFSIGGIVFVIGLLLKLKEFRR